MSFLKRIDALYEERKSIYEAEILNKKNNVFDFKALESDFCCYLDIQAEDVQLTKTFIVQKNKKLRAKLLIVAGKQRIYLSDEDIIKTILKMEKEYIDWFLNAFIRLFNNGHESFNFKLEGELFKGVGIRYFPNKKEILLLSDTLLDINDFIFVLNFIFSKDKQYEEDSSKENFSKSTIVKYITLIDYYANKAERSKKYLTSIGYPIDDPNTLSAYDIKKIFLNINSFDISQYL